MLWSGDERGPQPPSAYCNVEIFPGTPLLLVVKDGIVAFGMSPVQVFFVRIVQ